MRKPNAVPGLIFVVIFGVGLALAYSTISFADYAKAC